MPTVYYSQDLQNQRATPRVINDAGTHGSRVRCAMFGEDLNDGGSATLETGDQIRLCRLPSNARLVYISLKHETIISGGDCIAHIGLYHAPSGDPVQLVGGTLGVDFCPDTIAKDIDLSELETTMSKRYHVFPDSVGGGSGTGHNMEYAGHPLWKYTGATLASVTEDTGVDYYLTVTMGSTGTELTTNVAFGSCILYTID